MPSNRHPDIGTFTHYSDFARCDTMLSSKREACLALAAAAYL